MNDSTYRSAQWKLSALFTCLTLLFISASASADEYRTYSGSSAASYALGNYNRAYGISSWENPFTDYSSLLVGGNCTNFVSQAILGGLLRTSSAKTAFDKRQDFDIDRISTSTYKWFFVSDAFRGPAWTGAHKLFEYAKYNKSSYKGLHFTLVTKDTLSSFMDYTKVKVGDIVFADWNHDGRIDHSMIVTAYESWRLGYNEIRVTSQSTNFANRGLGDINEKYRSADGTYQALFYVYRPTDYNPSGL